MKAEAGDPVAPGYMYMWEYVVAADKRDEFERVYGPAGEWVQLFRLGSGHVRTELHRDRATPGRYVTIDYWTSESAWTAFKARFAEPFAQLDARCEALTARESEIGRFEPAGRR